MASIDLQVMVSRLLLGQPDLDVNDHSNYYMAPSSPAQVSWQRTSVSSVFVDDDITVHRRRSKVMESMLLEVMGTDQATLSVNLSRAIAAFTQDYFTIEVTFDGTEYEWACEAADYQVIWSGPRMIAKQVQLQLTVPRSPVPLTGAF